MANVFSGSELVEIGIEIEKNGKDFYDTLTGRSKNKKAKEIFEFLKTEEERHISVFTKILSAVHKYEPQEAYPGEYFSYMKALADQYIFTQKDKGVEIAKKTKNDKEAVDVGIGFEKDSIVFYEGMLKAVPEEEHGVVSELIRQEQNHLVKLTELKKTL